MNSLQQPAMDGPILRTGSALGRTEILRRDLPVLDNRAWRKGALVRGNVRALGRAGFGGVVVMKFRKKPVVIEAFQMTKERRADNREWPQWLSIAWNKDFHEAGAVSCEDFPRSEGNDRLVIRTLEGVHTVSWDDWIIQGVNGELYPCKPDIFEKTYESAD